MSWAQNKGKDLGNIAKSKLDEVGPYYISKKFDGHYTQIEYDGEKVRFFTSGGKEFYIDNMARDIMSSSLPPFKIECEYLYACDGKLGSRGKSARLTTYRTNFNNGRNTIGHPNKDTFVILDWPMPERCNKRLFLIKEYFKTNIDFNGWFMVPEHDLGDLVLAKRYAAKWVKEGYEGAMAKQYLHIYTSGKRVNDIIKLKPRPTADLLCIGTNDGEGKYEGQLGSLILKDSKGRIVSTGSGMSDEDRLQDPNYFIGKVIEVFYERIDKTYIQPSFGSSYVGVLIREDKRENDID